MGTPSVAWKLSLQNDCIQIVTDRHEISIPLAMIQSFKLVIDDNWDKLKGMEDRTLLAKIGRFSCIGIPGSSENFDAVLKEIRKQRTIEIENLD